MLHTVQLHIVLHTSLHTVRHTVLHTVLHMCNSQKYLGSLSGGWWIIDYMLTGEDRLIRETS